MYCQEVQFIEIVQVIYVFAVRIEIEKHHTFDFNQMCLESS